MNFIRHLALFCLLLLSPLLKAQDLDNKETARLTPKELAIPASPVFDLMGVVPSQVVRTDEIRDFKVDWSFKSWRLNPNLAIEAKPFWEILYNRKNIEKYQKAPMILRKLASVDVSVGTVQNEQNDRRIGFAIKTNIIRGKDPLLQKELYVEINERYKLEKENLEKQLLELEHALDTVGSVLQKPAIRQQIKTTIEQLNSINSRRQQEINEAAKVFVAENWNSPSLDIAFGKIYTYQTDSAGSLVSLRINRNTAWALWVNGGFGIGKKIMISGLFRASFYEEQLNFQILDTATQLFTPAQAIASSQLYSLGLNVRYGGPKYSFFAEFFMEQKSSKTAGEALDKVFNAAPGTVVAENTVKWDVVPPYTLNFGGDWRISRNLMLNYGIRCLLDKQFNFKTFTPVVSISCMMR